MKKQKASVLMITESAFPADIRVRKEADHLKKRMSVSVIALKGEGEKYYEKAEGVSIYRIPELPDVNLGKIRYIFQYLYFTLISLGIFIITLPMKKYKVVHVHNPPDTLFVVGLLGKLLGIKFVFDHHDLSPNLYLTRFSGGKGLIYKVLIFCEKCSCRLADAIIATNESYKEIELERHKINPDKIYVVRNNPIIDDCVFAKNTDSTNSKKLGNRRKKLLFIGAINPQDGLHELLAALHYLVSELKETNFVCDIVGGGDSLTLVQQQASDMRLNDYINFTGDIYDREVVKTYLTEADIGVEPAPHNELNEHSTFIKIMEYMAAGKPIVAFDLKETRYSTGGNALLVPSGDTPGFACSIKKLLHNPELAEDLGLKGFNRIEKELNWQVATEQLDRAYLSFGIPT